jgi:hypothetical protein
MGDNDLESPRLNPSNPHQDSEVQQQPALPPGRPFLVRLDRSGGKKKDGHMSLTVADAIASEFACPDL